MIARALKTRRVSAKDGTLFQLLDESIEQLSENSVLAITSKIVALCEGAVVPVSDVSDKQQLVRQQSQYYLENAEGIYGINFTVAQDTLIPNSGIDESNVGDVYALWPSNPQQTANQVREYLAKRFNLKNVGVIITDSTCRPMRRGVSGIYLAYSGFLPLKNYVGQPDLFGRDFKVSQADIAGGLAATAVMVMGEGSESTPIALLEDLSFVQFVSRNPNAEELASTRITLEEDLFYPFLSKAKWLPGGQTSV